MCDGWEAPGTLRGRKKAEEEGDRSKGSYRVFSLSPEQMGSRGTRVEATGFRCNDELTLACAGAGAVCTVLYWTNSGDRPQKGWLSDCSESDRPIKIQPAGDGLQYYGSLGLGRHWRRLCYPISSFLDQAAKPTLRRPDRWEISGPTAATPSVDSVGSVPALTADHSRSRLNATGPMSTPPGAPSSIVTLARPQAEQVSFHQKDPCPVR